jgi:formate dehydrogenase iron-sulfur subunit
MAKGVLVDLTRCIGCRACQVACKQWHGLPAQETELNGAFTNPSTMNADCYTRIGFWEEDEKERVQWNFVKNQCMHCLEPACVSACPVGALQKTPEGPIIYDQWKCIGCRYEWDTTNPWIQKCDFCADRIAMGRKPACVEACPMEAMYFDQREKVVAEAKRRINNDPARYVSQIYGLNEAGGTSWMYISDRPFKGLGFNGQIPNKPYPAMTWKPSLSKIFWEEAGVLVLLAGIAYIRNRRKHEEGQQ